MILDPYQILRSLTPLVPLLVAGTGTVLAVLFAARLTPVLRQRAYDRTSEREVVRLVVAPPAGLDKDPELAVQLIRGLHPRQRRGFDAWRLGWPKAELRVVWRDGQLSWEISTNRQLAALATAQLRALYPGVQVDESSAGDLPAVAVAVGRLERSGAWPLRELVAPEARVLRALAGAIEGASAAAEVRLRLTVRPIPPDAWRRQVEPSEAGTSASILGLIGTAIIDAVLLRPTAASSHAPAPIRRAPAERDALVGKQRGVVAFEVSLLLEVAGIGPEAAEALLWRLAHFTNELDEAGQGIRWEIHRGSSSTAPPARLADWEVAQLWYLPDASFDRAGFERARPLAAAPPCAGLGSSLVIGESRGRPLAIQADVLARHLAVFGSTGSGKSTLLLNLVLALAQSPIGATVIDPHGDLTTDILARLPASAASRVHVLRLADRDHPRGFNFLERRSLDEAQLVTSEFVYMLEDLWPRFCGPKMQHYLRHGLLTLLADERPQTILELTRILTDDGFRAPFVRHLGDPMLRSFWETQWPAKGERERDTSIKAVLNKLGAFVTYESIRAVVGQGTSTIRPRELMDRGEILLVDLSGVGGDNANLFGAMLVSRYYVDAVGRQGIPRDSRRQHVLVIDEAQRFGTRALENISVEGRKFGLALALASQSLGGLGERLGHTILTNMASIALLAPGAEDVRGLARLFAPVTAEQLTGLRAFEVVMRMPGREGRPMVTGGLILPPGVADPAVALQIVGASDRSDTRPLEEVQGEVRRRAGGHDETPPTTGGGPGPARAPVGETTGRDRR
jgi:hypothetical protein